MADFLRDSTGWVHLNRLDDGSVACCICYEFTPRDELEPVSAEPEKKWDVCLACAAMEKSQGATHY